MELSSYNGWLAYAQWRNEQQAAIDLFSVEWTVPPAPRERLGQTLLLFPGLQNAHYILQSVLQWGPSHAGGGPYWSIANWYTDGTSANTQVSPCLRVEPGQRLHSRMELLGQEGRDFSYKASFEGYKTLDLTLNKVTELLWAFVVLETNGLGNALQYPAEYRTRIDAVRLNTGGQHTQPRWRPVQRYRGTAAPQIVAGSCNTIDIIYPSENAIPVK